MSHSDANQGSPTSKSRIKCVHIHTVKLLRVSLRREYQLRYGTMVPSVSGSTLKVLNMMGPIGYINR